MTSELRPPIDHPGHRRAARARAAHQRRMAAAGGVILVAGGMTAGVVLSTRGPQLALVHYTTVVPRAKSVTTPAATVMDPPPLVIPPVPPGSPTLATESAPTVRTGTPAAPPEVAAPAVAAPALPPVKNIVAGVTHVVPAAVTAVTHVVPAAVAAVTHVAPAAVTAVAHVIPVAAASLTALSAPAPRPKPAAVVHTVTPVHATTLASQVPWWLQLMQAAARAGAARQVYRQPVAVTPARATPMTTRATGFGFMAPRMGFGAAPGTVSWFGFQR